MKQLRLVCLNAAIRLSNTQRILDFLKEQNADFIAIQEMVRHLDDSVHPQFRLEEHVTGALEVHHPYSFFAPIWLADAFKKGDKIDLDFGGHIEQGLSMLSAFPITGGKNEFYHRSYEYIQDWSNWRQEDHGRSVQITEFDVDGVLLQILNVHGIWTADKQGDERTIKQCEYIVAAASRRDIPTIIAGDFNLLPETSSIEIVSKKFRNLVKEHDLDSTRPTFEDGIDKGNHVVDYIFVNDLIDVKDFRAVQSDISDHLPLVLDFAIKSRA